jgi:hypothetical protein
MLIEYFLSHKRGLSIRGNNRGEKSGIETVVMLRRDVRKFLKLQTMRRTLT